MEVHDGYRYFKEKCLFYKFPNISTIQREKSILISRSSGIRGFGRNEERILEWSHGEFCYQCYVSLECYPFYYLASMYFKVSKSIVDFLTHIKKLTEGCTYDSIKHFLKDYPYTYKLIKPNFFEEQYLSWSFDCLDVSITCNKDNLFNKAREYTYHIDGLISEMSNMQLDTKCLKRKEPIIDLSRLNVPAWFKVAATIGTLVAVKIIVKSIGQDIDVNFDTDADVSDINLDLDTDLDLYTNYTPEEYVNIGEQYNVAFGADKITVHQEGNISREIELYIEKVAGTSHSWNVMKEKNGKIIATINSLTNGKFYIPGFGTGVL